MQERSALEELHDSIQEALTYLNRWGNRKDEKWIEENWAQLLDKYLDKYIAVINNAVIEFADTPQALKQRIRERKLPLFLPVIRKIEAKTSLPPSIAELIQQGESGTLEFKMTFQYDADQPDKKNEELRFAVLKTIAAFLNTEGGTLIIGVMDDGTIFGLENDFSLLGQKQSPADIFEQTLINLVNDRISKIFAQFIKIRFKEIEGKQVCAVTVAKAAKPALVKKTGTKNLLY
jgi:hypothetical protein